MINRWLENQVDALVCRQTNLVVLAAVRVVAKDVRPSHFDLGFSSWLFVLKRTIFNAVRRE
jgi:hypothetical protein